MTLDELRVEYHEEVIGLRWLSEVVNACRNVTTSYSPEIYAGGLSWRDEMDDLVQEVIVDRLLGEHQLEYLIDVAVTIGDLRRLLGRQVRITLAHRRRRTVVDQLLKRARPILDDAPFVKVDARRPAWTIDGRVIASGRTTSSDLRVAERRVRSIPQISGRGDSRAPMIYRTDDLKVLLNIVAQSLHTAVTLDDLDRLFTSLLTSFLPSILESTGNAPADPADADAYLEEPDVTAAVNDLVDSLDAGQRMILAAKIAGASDADLAAALGVSRPTAAARKQSALSRVEAHLRPLTEAGRRTAVERLGVALAGAWPREASS